MLLPVEESLYETFGDREADFNNWNRSCGGSLTTFRTNIKAYLNLENQLSKP